MALEAIKYERGSLQILDQLQLPHKVVYHRVRTAEDAFNAIKSMQVRGAPAIAIVAALGVAVDLTSAQSSGTLKNDDPVLVQNFISKRLDYLIASRPTAVNLAGAAAKLKETVQRAAINANGQSVGEVYVEAAERMLVDDIQDNEAIGHYGSEWILHNAPSSSNDSVSVLTHCNTGSLATAGYGTALGVIRSLHAKGSLKHAFCTESRPYNQGSRLTAFELVHDKIPATLITDSMAAALLQLKGVPENIAAIVVGADRVAANGDTANKIGTFTLAVLAKFHGVKFLVAAPRTTIDLNTPNGRSITIEERPANELTRIRGPIITGDQIDVDRVESVSIAAQGIGVWNPAFDITPCSLIDGIITEVGVVEKDGSGVYDLHAALERFAKTANANCDIHNGKDAV